MAHHIWRIHKAISEAGGPAPLKVPWRTCCRSAKDEQDRANEQGGPNPEGDHAHFAQRALVSFDVALVEAEGIAWVDAVMSAIIALRCRQLHIQR